jgi:hypothetical protein
VPKRFTVRSAAIFRAGLELSALHLGLALASAAVRRGAIASLMPLAGLFRWMATLLEWMGTDRGGMTVDAMGSDGRGAPVHARWSLVAESGDGPFVPTLPALATIRALADGRISGPGAFVCAGILPLRAIAAEFGAHRIRVEAGPGALYEGVLGAAFQALPAPIRRMHSPGQRLLARGVARVDGASTSAARVVAAMFGFPPAGERVPVTVAMTAEPGREKWVRDFGGRRFASLLSVSDVPGCLEERFGPFRFRLGLDVGTGGVTGMPIRSWRIGPVPLPRFLAPVSLAREDVDAEGRFRFDVEMRLPLGLGHLVRYRGWLLPDEDAPA